SAAANTAAVATEPAGTLFPGTDVCCSGNGSNGWFTVVPKVDFYWTATNKIAFNGSPGYNERFVNASCLGGGTSFTGGEGSGAFGPSDQSPDPVTLGLQMTLALPPPNSPIVSPSCSATFQRESVTCFLGSCFPDPNGWGGSFG